MSDTQLSVVCKNCGSEVSPYVTECPYCGTRIRKRAPKLERRDGNLEAKPDRRQRRAASRRARSRPDLSEKPVATFALIGVSAVMLLLLTAAGSNFDAYGGLIVPLAHAPWRYITTPFVYSDVGYWFVIALALAIFGPPLERRLGTVATAILLIACGALGALGAYGIENSRDTITVISGGNGVALGALAAYLVLRMAETARAVDDDFDRIGVAVAGLVLLLLPVFDHSANVYAGVIGGLFGAVAAFSSARMRRAR